MGISIIPASANIEPISPVLWAISADFSIPWGSRVRVRVSCIIFNSNQVIIYKNEINDFVINSGNVIIANVKVFDVRGRLLQERRNVNASQTTISVGLANEMLLIQITSKDDVTVVKKVVR